MAAGNEWINGYLEAILDAGVKLREQGVALPRLKPLSPSTSSLADEARAGAGAASYSPTRYFVEEVVSRFDDRDLHKTWTKVVAMRNSQERNNRLENLCWRIWHVARKKKQVEWEYSRQLAQRRLEQELGSREAAEELSELSEGEKDGKPDTAHLSTAQPDGGDQQQQQSRFARMNSDVRVVSDEEDEESKNKNLYIVLISHTVNQRWHGKNTLQCHQYV